MLRLLTFGGLGLEADVGSSSRLRSPKLALLAVLAAAGDRGVSRERLVGFFWPDADDQRAAHSLRQARYALRNDLGHEVVRADGPTLSLDPAVITSDVAELHAALAAGDRERAAALARGSFLDGFYLAGAEAFERWVEEERARLATIVLSTLQSLATDASAARDLDAAVRWWRELTLRDPLSGRFAVGYLRSLKSRGDRVEALAFARQHETLVRRELEADPDPEIKRLEAELRAMPTPAAPRVPVEAAPLAAPAVPEHGDSPSGTAPMPPPAVTHTRSRRRVLAVGATAALVLVATAAVVRRLGLLEREAKPAAGPVYLREDGLAPVTTSSPMAYRLYEEGLRSMAINEPRGAARLMHAALEQDSTFAMAAYYEAVLAAGIGGDRLPDGRTLAEAQSTAMRLAARASERERLTISANLLVYLEDPRSLAIAESLATKYPNDPRAFATLGHARWNDGNWAGAVAAIERAIAFDSLAEANGGPACHLCEDYGALEEAYSWWDSLPGVARAARRHQHAKPSSSASTWYSLMFVAARQGDSAAAYDAFRRTVALSGGDPGHQKLRLDLMLGAYDEVEKGVRPLLASTAAGEWADGYNALLFALRNEGRLRDATELHTTGWLPAFPAVPRSPNDFDEGILALERGDGRAAADVFAKKSRQSAAHWSDGYRARVQTWNATLQGMALAAAGDTNAVRVLADSVERWGHRSAYGRDRKAHHYLRGLMFVARRSDEDAVREFRAAIHSPNLGFTRVNYELARALLRTGRPNEAVATLQSSLHGEIDASNLYITRTDLHELLAQAFDAAGQRDSAAAHYRAVVTAWKRADPIYHARRARASAWLSQHAMLTANR